MLLEQKKLKLLANEVEENAETDEEDEEETSLLQDNTKPKEKPKVVVSKTTVKGTSGTEDKLT